MGDWDDWPDDDGDAYDWDKPRPRPTFFRRNVKDLIEYFSYHREMNMSKQVESEDKALLGYTFQRLIKGGYSEEALQRAIDVFFQSLASDSKRPARAFMSTEVMDSCLEGVAIVLDPDEYPLFHWLLEGMEDTDVLSEVKDKRKAVILTCHESFRYPEVICEILSADKSFAATYAMLSSLEEVVKYNLAGKPYDTNDVIPHLEVISWCDLPRELVSKVPAPRSIRAEKETVGQYISSYLSRRKKEMQYS